MESCIPLIGVLKAIAGFCVAGLAIVLVAGPVLSILAIAATFAVVGLGVWAPLHTFVGGPRGVCQKGLSGGRNCWQAGRKAVHSGCEAVGDFVESWWPWVCNVCREAFSGAVVGGVVTGLAGGVDGAVAVGVLVGLTLGAVVGATSR